MPYAACSTAGLRLWSGRDFGKQEGGGELNRPAMRQGPAKVADSRPTLLLARSLHVRESEDRVGLKGCALLSGF